LAKEKEGGFEGMRVERLEERMGFAGAVNRACCEWVETPYVLVVQHDRLFMTRGGARKEGDRAGGRDGLEEGAGGSAGICLFLHVR